MAETKLMDSMSFSGTFLDAASGMRHAGAGQSAKSPRPRRPTTGSSVHHLHLATSFRLSTSLVAVRQGQQSQNSSEQVLPKYQTNFPSFIVAINASHA